MTIDNDNLDGSPRRRAQAIARQYGCEFVDLAGFHIGEELLKRMPDGLIFRCNFVPLEEISHDQLAIAVADPSQLLMLDEISGLLKKRIVIRVSTLRQISKVLKRAEASGQ